MPKGFVVAGPSSGAGKTTVTLGVMAALKRRGLIVQPFKCGPDFINPGHHRRVCGRPSRNLDGWMLTAERNRGLFSRHANTADVSVVEGMMGLFDGVRGPSSAGSTAEMASILNLPVVLVVDASTMAASAAALVHGFATFNPRIRLAGVVFNRVGSASHYGLLAEAVSRAARVPTLGYLPANDRLRIPERYLGLITADEDGLSDEALTYLAELVERHIDLNRLLDVAGAIASPVDEPAASTRRPPVRIGVARDRAFCFYYEDNLDALEAAGATLVAFSPMTESALPDELDALYFGGGYPELWAECLSANHSMRGAVARFIDAGRPTYAECGGLMYLSQAIRGRDGRTSPMVGALPFSVTMTDRLQRFGYVEIVLARDGWLGTAGAVLRGQSFHCSALGEPAAEVAHAYQARCTLTGALEAEGFTVGSVLASYVHIHFLSHPSIAAAFCAHVVRERARTSSYR